MPTCPTDDELLAFARGLLDPSRAAELRSHASSCETCAASVAEAARGLAGTGAGAGKEPDEAPREPTLQPGAKLGRYALLEVLGKGAMGTVYSAYDPQLDRRIAIKVLRTDTRVPLGSEVLQLRLLREAQAMARLRHPNVLAIYDAVSFEGGIFLAMDLIKGGTVREWLQKGERTPAEILEVFRQAGEGLAAAHRAGIVHRDFKSENVLRDESGHVYVTDFGVARLDGELASGAPDGIAVPLAITHAGTMLGTPAYMAPEQLRGEPADERSDIFGFCVALYEALYGAHPFPMTTLAELREAICEGRVRVPPSRKGVRPRTARAILRGLRPLPGDRFQTMDELLRALVVPKRRAWLLVAPAAIALALIAVVSVRKLEERQLATCRLGDGRLARLFDDGQQQAVQAAFAKSGSPAAQAVFVSTRAGLLKAIDAIFIGRAEACAAHQRGDASSELFDRHMQCLEERTQDAAALIDAFKQADATAVEKAVSATEQLADPAACADRRRLLDASPLPRDQAAQARISEVREELAQVAALHQAGHYQEGLLRSAPVVEAAEKTGYAPLESEALVWRGRLLFDGNEQSKAPDELIAAAAAATRARRDDLLIQAESQLVRALGWAQKTEEALRWAQLARALLARNGDDPLPLADLLLARAYAQGKVFHSADALLDGEQALALLEAQAQSAPAHIVLAQMMVAGLRGNAGQYQKALEYDQLVLPLAEKTFGPLHPLTLSVRANTGTMYTQLGDNRSALPILRRTLADRRTALGPDHLDVARSCGALGAALNGLGDQEESVAAFAESNAIVEKRLGPDHPELIANLALIADPLAKLGRFDEAAASLDRSEALARKHQGEKSGMLGFILEERASVLELAGRFAEASRAYQEAAARIAATAPDHPDIVVCKAGVARQLRRTGHAAEALTAHTAILSAEEKRLGPASKDLIDRLVDEGDDLLALHRDAEAGPLFDRALALIEPEQSDPLGLAEIRYSAARALWPSDPKRALDLARAARATLAASRLPRGTLREDVGTFLAAREPEAKAR